VAAVGAVRFGPSGLPPAETPEAAIGLLAAGGYAACEVGFVGGFRMSYEDAATLGEAARDAGVVLSVHAPLAAFLGQPDEKKRRQAVGMLDHTAGLATACGAEVVVFHPGFLLGRTREETIESVVSQLGELRERLEAKSRAVDFGVEVMGRVRDFGTADDCVAIAAALPWVRPVLDFAHLHAVSDGAYTDAEPFAAALAAADGVTRPGAAFHVHFSDIAYANSNETRHLPYGEGTLRAEPLAEALARFERPATVISESPDEVSTRAIGRALASARGGVR